MAAHPDAAYRRQVPPQDCFTTPEYTEEIRQAILSDEQVVTSITLGCLLQEATRVFDCMLPFEAIKCIGPWKPLGNKEQNIIDVIVLALQKCDPAAMEEEHYSIDEFMCTLAKNSCSWIARFRSDANIDWACSLEIRSGMNAPPLLQQS
jgi:hypothetical protein